MQNANRSAQNQINSLNTLKNELVKIFRGFRVFEYALWQKTKTRKCRISTESFLNKKNPLVTVTISRKLLESYQFAIQVPVWLEIKKSHFQGSIVNSH